MVSLSTLFHVSPSGYSTSLTNLRALVWKSSRLMEPWKSLELHNSNQSIWFGWDVFLKQFKVPCKVVPVSISNLSFYFPFVCQFHSSFSRPVDDVVAFNTITSSIEWTSEENFHLFLPFPEAFQQTIIISPVQSWSLVTSSKVSHCSAWQKIRVTGNDPIGMEVIWNFHYLLMSILTGLTAPIQLTGLTIPIQLAGLTAVSRFVVVIVLQWCNAWVMLLCLLAAEAGHS